MVLSSVPGSLFFRRMMARKVLLRYVISPSDRFIRLLSSVKLHFQETYNIRIRNDDLFGVNISGKNNPHPSVIPAELCQVIPGQLYKRKVPEYLTAKVVEFSKIKPQDRFRKIAQSVSFLFVLDYLRLIKFNLGGSVSPFGICCGIGNANRHAAFTGKCSTHQRPTCHLWWRGYRGKFLKCKYKYYLI